MIIDNKVITQNDLTTEQWDLYKYLKKQYELDQDKWLFLEEDVYWFLRDNYTFLRPKTTFNNQPARRQITRDINALKNSKVIQVIVLSNSKGVKIATEKEAYDELVNEKIKLLKSLKTVNYQLNKIQKDGQLRLVLNYEKDMIETFIRNFENKEKCNEEDTNQDNW